MIVLTPKANTKPIKKDLHYSYIYFFDSFTSIINYFKDLLFQSII